MPICLFWGEDDFALDVAVKQMQKSVLDPNWSQFNYERIPGDRPDAVVEALNLVMTPVFGTGGRLVWLAETTICQHCSEDLLSQLKRTLPAIPETSYLLFSTSKKPDRRLKSTKLLQKYAQIREFSAIPPWKTEEIAKKVELLSQEIGVKLPIDVIQLLAESVGNNTRQLWNELQKLSVYGQTKPLDVDSVSSLVNSNTENSLQLAAAIRTGKQSRALKLVGELINRNEPALRIVATLIGQFRTWAIVKLMIVKGEKDEKVIAKAAEISNPKRIYFLRQEIQSISSPKLLATFPILLELEFSLKRGGQPLSSLQTKIIELCQIFQ